MLRNKGNINYKYLRRRKNWFQRNIFLIVVTCIISICVIAGIIGVSFLINHNNQDAKVSNNEDFISSNNSANGEAEVMESTVAAKEPVWYENAEPVYGYSVDYSVPEGISNPYYIKVNRALNCVTVYGIDSKGEYSIPVKAFACSCGRENNDTVVGSFSTSDKFLWAWMEDGSVAQYVTRFYGSFLFHSVPYNTYYAGDLEEGQFNKLGSYASLGCVRMCVRDAKWIYENCGYGTGVEVYDDETNPGPLGKPESIKIPEESVNAGWDPTDPADGNPWSSYKAQITGTVNVTVKKGDNIDLMSGIKALDTCGNDITSKIVIVGKYTFDVAGTYNLKYVVIDAIGSRAEESFTLTVTE